jgi:hypothetical protein
MRGKYRFGYFVNLKHHREMSFDDMSIDVIVTVAKVVDESLMFGRQLRVAECEKTHRPGGMRPNVQVNGRTVG